MFMYIRLQIHVHRRKRKKNTSQISFIILMSCTEFVLFQRLSTLPNINMPKYCLSISNDLMYNFHFSGKIFFMKSGHYKTTCWANSLSFPVVCFIWINSWCLFKDSSYVICGRHHPRLQSRHRQNTFYFSIKSFLFLGVCPTVIM